MLIAGQKPAAPRRVDLGRGVAVTLRPLTAVEQNRIFATVARELRDLTDDNPGAYAWSIAARELEALRAGDEAAREALAGWMRSVLLAEAAAESLEGVVTEAGAPPPLEFDTFAWLLCDPEIESRFRIAALATEQLYEAEKNASGRGPAGSGATASTIAPDAAPSETPAPAAAGSADSTDDGRAAPNSNTSPEPTRAHASGVSAPAPDSGAAAA